MTADALTINAEQPVVNSMMGIIERVATNGGGMDQIQALMDMQERQMNKVSEQAFNRAFAEAMAVMPKIPRSGLNKHTKNKYSTLDDVVSTTRPVLSKHGLALNWTTDIKDGVMAVTAFVRHVDGHKEQNSKSAPVDAGKSAAMNMIQAQGSTETYLKRYTALSLLGLSSGDEVDDDALGSSPQELITADQFQILRQMIEAAGLEDDIVAKAERVQDLVEIKANRFDAICRRLQATIDKKVAANA